LLLLLETDLDLDNEALFDRDLLLDSDLDLLLLLDLSHHPNQHENREKGGHAGHATLCRKGYLLGL
jgi:hypothetical protein